jgi:hypothetical protein
MHCKHNVFTAQLQMLLRAIRQIKIICESWERLLHRCGANFVV